MPVADNARLDAVVDAYEAALIAGALPRLEEHLPPRSDASYFETLCELIRVDLEFRHVRGEPVAVDDYLSRFSELAGRRESVERIAFEDYRVRRRLDLPAEPIDYARRFGVNVESWPRAQPAARSPAAESGPSFPAAGSEIGDFDLLEELGRGSFGRVYLARQRDLAHRLVALKLTTAATAEPDLLAQLQHENIVPIYSVHRGDPWQAVCMPYLGRRTLADALREFQRQGATPATGRDLLSTLAQQSDDTLAERQSGIAGEITPPLPRDRHAAEAARLAFRDAAVWVAAQLAAGLVHAHDRGVVHRDLKPANILLADDGRPMILDFGLAHHGPPSDSDLVGGTPPYMSPEQLRAIRDGGVTGPGADIYALGVVLFELLTGSRPFPSRHGVGAEAIERMLADRERGAPPVREYDAGIPRSLAHVVAKCLAPQESQRYASAAELREDLERHLRHEPLRHVPDRWLPERSRKWTRRHPRLASLTSASLVSLVIVVVLFGAWWSRGRQIARLDAEFRLQELTAAIPATRIALSAPDISPADWLEAESVARTVLGPWNVFADADWREDSAFRLLKAEDQQAARRRVGETLHLLARAAVRRAELTPDKTARAALFERAFDYNRLARRTFLPDAVPAAIERHTARIRAALQDKPTAEASGENTPALEDGFFAAIELLQQRNWRAAEPLLKRLIAETPEDVSLWFLLGNSQAGLREWSSAEASYEMAIALAPDSYLVYFHRGLARLDQSRPRAAAEDFDRVLQLRPGLAAALFNRGVAWGETGDARRAVDDLSAALVAGATETRLYFLRARYRRAEGDADGAAADEAQGLALTPADESSWIARGMARLNSAPEQGLADFRAAVELNPQSRAGWRNISHVLAERLGRTREALVALERAVEVDPDSAATWAECGVLHARLQERDAALADVERALKLQPDPRTAYKAACALALLATNHPDDAPRAIHLLGQALARDPTLGKLAKEDADLTAIRHDPAVQRLLEAAAVVAEPAAKRPPAASAGTASSRQATAPNRN